MKKSIIIASIVIILALVGGGVFWYIKQEKKLTNEPVMGDNKQEDVEQVGINNVVEDMGEEEQESVSIKTNELDEEIDTSSWKICQHEELGIKLKYPKEWSECITEESKLSKNLLDRFFGENSFCDSNSDNICFVFNTNHEKYKLYLALSIHKNNNAVNYVNNLREDLSENDKLVDYYIRNGKATIIYKYGSSGDGYYYYLTLSDNLYYINWDTESNQSAPEGLDGIWRHESNITTSDKWNILKTIELIEN